MIQQYNKDDFYTDQLIELFLVFPFSIRGLEFFLSLDSIRANKLWWQYDVELKLTIIVFEFVKPFLS